MSRQKKMELKEWVKDLGLSGITLAGGLLCLALGVRLSVL
jgi:hypothetical protein